MLEDLFNHLLILDETDDFHPSLTFGASQGVRLIDLLDQSGPVFPVLLSPLLRHKDTRYGFIQVQLAPFSPGDVTVGAYGDIL